MKNNNNKENKRNEDKVFEAWKGEFLAFVEMARP